MKRLTHLSLFSGIGGLDLAAERAGLQTVGQCEFADYPYKVLCKHWPDVPKWRDIRTLTGEDFHARTGLRTVDVLSGGFPCQPFSVAGKRRGTADDRYLWPEMLRVIKELRPAWVIGENVAGIVNMALDTVLSELEAEGYETRAFIVPACGVDAPHRRDRVAIVARHNDSEPNGREPYVAHSTGEGIGGLPVQPWGSYQTDTNTFRIGENVADTNQQGIQGREEAGNAESKRTGAVEYALRCSERIVISHSNQQMRNRPKQYKDTAGREGLANGSWWPAEPRVGRVAHGVPHRVDRLKGLGNAVVPAQFYPFFVTIAEIERSE